jgi:hypothetical protein
MMAPAVMVSAAPAPTIVMATTTAAHMSPSVSMTTFHLNDGVILHNERADGYCRQPCRSRSRHRQRRGDNDSNQCYVFHGCVFPGRMIAILTQYPGPKIVPVGPVYIV